MSKFIQTETPVSAQQTGIGMNGSENYAVTEPLKNETCNDATRLGSDSELLRLIIDENVDNSLDAWDRIYSAYRHSVNRFIRQRGFSVHEAEDLTQRFFVFLIGRGYFKKADLKRGSLETFLMVILKSFLANDWQNRHTLKRGGGFTFVSFEDLQEISGIATSVFDAGVSTEARIERDEALQILQKVILILEKEYVERGKLELFKTLEPGLIGEPDQESRQRWANSMGMSSSTLRVSLHRLRRRFGEILRSQFSQHGQTADDINQNIRHFLGRL